MTVPGCFQTGRNSASKTAGLFAYYTILNIHILHRYPKGELRKRRMRSVQHARLLAQSSPVRPHVPSGWFNQHVPLSGVVNLPRLIPTQVQEEHCLITYSNQRPLPHFRPCTVVMPAVPSALHAVQPTGTHTTTMNAQSMPTSDQHLKVLQ